MSRQTIYMSDDIADYLISVSGREPDVLAALRQETLGLPGSTMQISLIQGQFMGLIVRMTGAKRIIEVGTYTGYSSTVMAMALPQDGALVACDINQEWTDVAKRYWAKAGVEDKITLHLAPALETLDKLIDEGQAERFDLAFIDADKGGYGDYWERCLTLLRPGGLIIVDNVLFMGGVPEIYDDAKLARMFTMPDGIERPDRIDVVHTIRAFNRKIHHDERVDLAMIPVGDGMTLALKR